MRRHSSSRRAPARAHREDARERARGGVQGLVNWGPRLSPERSASVSQIAGMVAIQTQAIFSIEGHDRKFPTRVLFCSTPSLFEVAGCESAQRWLQLRHRARSRTAPLFHCLCTGLAKCHVLGWALASITIGCGHTYSEALIMHSPSPTTTSVGRSSHVGDWHLPSYAAPHSAPASTRRVAAN